MNMLETPLMAKLKNLSEKNAELNEYIRECFENENNPEPEQLIKFTDNIIMACKLVQEVSK